MRYRLAARASRLWRRSVTHRLTALSLLVVLLATLAQDAVVAHWLEQDTARALAAQPSAAAVATPEPLDQEARLTRLAMERQLLLWIAAIGVAVALLLSLLIRLQLRPLDRAASRLSAVRRGLHSGEPVKPLAVGRRDEVGELIEGFNALLAEIEQRQAALSQSELLYSTAFQTSPDAVSITRWSDGHCLQINESYTRLLGWKPEELVGRSVLSVGLWRRLEDRRLLMDLLAQSGRVEHLETEWVTREGRVLAVEVSASVMDLQGERCLLAIAHDLTARRQAQRQIETLAFSEPLTGLPNRRLLTDRLGQALADGRRAGQHTALLYIAIDDFQQLQNSQGQMAGDKLLRAVASELRAAIRLSDTVARLSASTFVVLAKDLATSAQEAAAQVQAVDRQVREAMERGMARLGVAAARVSIGIALDSGEAVDGQALMRHADLALHHAKAQGRGQSMTFNQEMLDTLSSRAALEADLRAALGPGPDTEPATEQLVLHYQPQIGPDERIVGAEALLRWTRPGHGGVPPSTFIPVAEDSGLILPLGRWVLESACQQLAQWAREPATAHLMLAVNVSSRQFQQASFVEEVQQALTRSGALPERLRLELTESVLIDSFDAVAARMEALKALGVGFSLDDFGTGFSSLGYLKRLPLDELKIDGSFVRDIENDPNDQAIAQVVIALGQTLGLQVVAEGVETEAQRQQLAAMGCRHYQGYLFGRPQPAAEFVARVRDQAPRA
jgi:diguanylate cyclase (GGDEF)-like protein/PAS domain S-box-containing protein